MSTKQIRVVNILKYIRSVLHDRCWPHGINMEFNIVWILKNIFLILIYLRLIMNLNHNIAKGMLMKGL